MKTKLFDAPTSPQKPATFVGFLYALGALGLVAAVLGGFAKRPEAAALFGVAGAVALVGAGIISELQRIGGRFAESPEAQATREQAEADAKKRAGYQQD